MEYEDVIIIIVIDFNWRNLLEIMTKAYSEIIYFISEMCLIPYNIVFFNVM